MVTFIILMFMCIGLFRIGKFAVSNPSASMKAASWLKNSLGK